MITEVDSRFCSDVVRYDFKYCCEDCVHYEPIGFECSLGFSSDPHRARPLHVGDTVVFCKAFELT
jgi:hypothetical protein